MFGVSKKVRMFFSPCWVYWNLFDFAQNQSCQLKISKKVHARSWNLQFLSCCLVYSSKFNWLKSSAQKSPRLSTFLEDLLWHFPSQIFPKFIGKVGGGGEGWRFAHRAAQLIILKKNSKASISFWTSLCLLTFDKCLLFRHKCKCFWYYGHGMIAQLFWFLSILFVLFLSEKPWKIFENTGLNWIIL